MCGIAGCYHFTDGRVDAHLAPRRLSIIDRTAAADQPFAKDGLVLSYIGELYYWRLAEVAATGPPVNLGAVVEQSVTVHLVADVPVSTFLSGGLDSSIVTVLAKRANPAIDAYTITFRASDQRLEAME